MAHTPIGLDTAQDRLMQQKMLNMRNQMQQAGTSGKISKADEEKIDKSAKDFEAMFLTQMLNHMFQGIKTDGPFGGGKGEEIWRSFMIQEYGKSIVGAGGIGLAQQVKQELLSLQEG